MAGVDGDVAIAGGGPAGLAAALTLRRFTRRRVVVVERSEYRGLRIGETASPGLQPLLRYLGAWESFLDDRHRPAHGTSAAWSTPALSARDFLFTGRGNGWHLDRCRFDRTLARQVTAAGGALLTGTRIAGCARRRDGRWQLSLVDGAGRRSALTARFLVDATGNASALARRLGARKRRFDLMVGVAAILKLRDRAEGWHYTLVEACAAGWWYSAPLPAGRAIAVLMSDSDLVRKLRAHDSAVWTRLLAATGPTRHHLAGGRLAAPPRILPAASQILDPAAGAGWIAAGDAVATFDPLTSAGIGHALASGIHAARAAHQALETLDARCHSAPRSLGGSDPPENCAQPGADNGSGEAAAPAAQAGSLLSLYGRQVARNVDQYLQLRQHLYAIERRWDDHPFWRRRHQSDAPG